MKLVRKMMAEEDDVQFKLGGRHLATTLVTISGASYILWQNAHQVAKLHYNTDT